MLCCILRDEGVLPVHSSSYRTSGINPMLKTANNILSGNQSV
jgi:hypothetical protein